MNDVECPYCDTSIELCYDDGAYCDERVPEKCNCPNCGKVFLVDTSIVLCHYQRKADCLNGEPHQFRDWKKLWLDQHDNEIQYRQCRDCGTEERRTV